VVLDGDQALLELVLFNNSTRETTGRWADSVGVPEVYAQQWTAELQNIYHWCDNYSTNLSI
jgi:hypothetical protein